MPYRPGSWATLPGGGYGVPRSYPISHAFSRRARGRFRAYLRGPSGRGRVSNIVRPRFRFRKGRGRRRFQGRKRLRRAVRKAANLHQEWKRHTQTSGVTTMTHDGTASNQAYIKDIFDTLAQGTTNATRIGNTVTAKYLEVDAIISYDTSLGNDNVVMYYTCALVRQEGTTALTFAQLFEDGQNTRTSRYLRTQKRAAGVDFRVLWRRKYSVNPQAAIGINQAESDLIGPWNQSNAGTAFPIMRRHKWKIGLKNMNVKYKAGTSDTFPRNWLFYIWQTDHKYFTSSAHGVLVFSLTFNMHFTDS